MKSITCLTLVLLLTVAQSASIRSTQSQINDPAKFRQLSDCLNKTYNKNTNTLCCDLKVNDMLNLTKNVCINLTKPNNLEPMKTIGSYAQGRCNYSSYAKGDKIERIWCKGSGNMDKAVMWQLEKFVRVLNPSNKQRTLEACDVNSNFSKCW
jgi:hypothetical protein